MRRAFAAHPRSKPFIEPEIVPPCHCHEIAKPLMCGLVRDDFIDALPRRGGRFLGIKEQPQFVISDSAPVFHRATETARDGDLIQFRQRVGNTEIIVVVLENLRCGFECVAAHFRFTFRCDDTDLGRSTSRFDEIQFASDENIEVTRHRRSRCKAYLLSIRDLFLAFNRHV